MELILGLPPMSQYDAAAVPLWRSFNHQPDSSAFTHVAPTFDLDNKNTAMNKWQRMSDGFDFKAEDRVPDALFNQVLWAAIKGDNKPCPAPVHAAFVRVRAGDKD